MKKYINPKLDIFTPTMSDIITASSLDSVYVEDSGNADINFNW